MIVMFLKYQDQKLESARDQGSGVDHLHCAEKVRNKNKSCGTIYACVFLVLAEVSEVKLQIVLKRRSKTYFLENVLN